MSEKSLELLEITTKEKEKAAETIKEYINSIAGFPQWLTLFSGLFAYLDIFNVFFTKGAFIFFITSSLLLLKAKRNASEALLKYVDTLNQVSNLVSEHSYKKVLFSKGQITKETLDSGENVFFEEYNKIRPQISISENNQGELIDIAFWLSIIGGLFLIFATVF